MIRRWALRSSCTNSRFGNKLYVATALCAKSCPTASSALSAAMVVLAKNTNQVHFYRAIGKMCTRCSSFRRFLYIPAVFKIGVRKFESTQAHIRIQKHAPGATRVDATGGCWKGCRRVEASLSLRISHSTCLRRHQGSSSSQTSQQEKRSTVGVAQR